MRITRRSMISGMVHTRDIDISVGQWVKWREGVPIQDAAPHLSDDDREFLITGATTSEWDSLFGKGE